MGALTLQGEDCGLAGVSVDSFCRHSKLFPSCVVPLFVSARFLHRFRALCFSRLGCLHFRHRCLPADQLFHVNNVRSIVFHVAALSKHLIHHICESWQGQRRHRK